MPETELTDKATERRPRRAWAWVAGGICLLVGNVELAVLSGEFAYERPILQSPVRLLVAVEIALGVFYLATAWALRNTESRPWLLAWVFFVGVVARAVMIPTTPILADDSYRYLWDGAVSASRVNPYQYAPKDVLDPPAEQLKRPPAQLLRLGRRAGVVLQRVSHPHLKTIYPPVTQVFFAVAHMAKPWSLPAWRGLLLGVDLVNLALLLLLLSALKLPPLWAAIYWWNPLLIREVFNSGHMDVIALPFALAALLVAIRGSAVPAALSLGIAVGAKVWPAVLLPALMRRFLPRPWTVVGATLVFVLVVAAVFTPVLAAGVDRGSGFVRYGEHWEMNDAAFMLIHWPCLGALRAFGADLAHGQLLARVVLLVLLAAWMLRVAWRPVAGGRDLSRRCLLVIAAVFLLSPTQFPWYYVWVLPFLALFPRLSLALWTALLPLYRLMFYCEGVERPDVFHYGVVWIEHLPVVALLVWEWVTGRWRAPAEAE